MTDHAEKARRLEQDIAAAERDIARRQENLDRIRTELAHLRSARPVELTFHWSEPDKNGDRELTAGIYSGVVQRTSDDYMWCTYFGFEAHYFGDGESLTEDAAMAAAEAAIREHTEGNTER